MRNRRRIVYYAILLLIILGELLGERNYIIIIFPEYDNALPGNNHIADTCMHCYVYVRGDLGERLSW